MDYAQRVQQLTKGLGAGAPDYSQRWRSQSNTPVAHVDGPAGPTKPNFGGSSMDRWTPKVDPAAQAVYDARNQAGRQVTGTGKSVGAQRLIDKMNTFVEVSPGKFEKWKPEYQPSKGSVGPVSPAVVLPPSPVGVSPAPSVVPMPVRPAVSNTYMPVREYENGATMYQNRVSGYLYWEGPNGERVEYQPRHDRMYVDGEQTTKFPSWLPIEEQRMIKSQGLR